MVDKQIYSTLIDLSSIGHFQANTKDLNFFSTQQWARTWLDDARYTSMMITSRIPKASGADEYFAKTLQTSSTIPQWLLMVNKAILAADSSSSNIAGPQQPDVVLFVSLGQGLNGFTDTTHGGVLCALLDETQSICAELHRRVQSSNRTTLYTANLNVNFEQPVQTPGAAVVKAWLESKEGRKWRLRALVLDCESRVCASASSLWIAARHAHI